MHIPPRRPYTLIHQPAPGSLELRLFRSSCAEPHVVFQIARPDEPEVTGGRILAIDADQLDHIFQAARATAALPPPGAGLKERAHAHQLITDILGRTRPAALLAGQVMDALAEAGLNIVADPQLPADEARAALADRLHETGADRG
ncbi:hypothetical protein [Streptosporangium canum]|uniref:hypothetical protein n=1 Tax=Streptosporangium canum TaxID=324952 RepID=UPI0033A292E0